MPSLPPSTEDEGENPLVRVRSTVGSAIGADHRVTLRMIVLLALAGVCVSFAPSPWAPIGVVAVVLIGLDVARRYTTR